MEEAKYTMDSNSITGHLVAPSFGDAGLLSASSS
jgi:hypothetical protein